MNRAFGVNYLVPLLAVLTAAGGATANPLADALTAHEAAIGMVDTIHFKFESSRERIASNGPPSERITGEYWRTHKAHRFTYSQPGLTQSIYTLPNQVVVIGQSVNRKTGRPLLTASITPNAGPIFVSVAPWRDALFALDSRRGMGTQQLRDHIREFLGKAKYKTEQGQCVITGENGVVTIRLDPKHNYLICGKTARREGIKNLMRPMEPPGVLQINEAVHEFQEVTPGIYFPKRVTIEERLGDELQVRRTVIFSAVQVNAPVAASVFEPKYKDGTEVNDFVRSLKYKVDATGHPQGPETPLNIIAVGPHPTKEVTEPALPTAEEERRWGWWLLPAGFSLVLAGLAIMLWRRSRN